MSERQDLSTLVDREGYRRLHWEGSFDEYLAIVRTHPEVTRNAHQRLYDIIMSRGVEWTEHFGKKVPRYHIFDDPDFNGDDALFGMDEPLSKLVEVIKAGAHEWEIHKRLILLYGPVGTAKSTAARILKKYTEVHSRSDEGALYTFAFDPNLGKLSVSEFDWEGIQRREGVAIEAGARQQYLEEKIPWVIGSAERSRDPLNEEPLKLIPLESRAKFLKELNQSTPSKVRIAGDLNPQSRFVFEALAELYGGDWTKVIANHIVVQRIVLTEVDKVGITTFEPGDPKNQDSTDLTGDVNWINVPKYGSDADPRAFSYDGEFHKGNRGIIEFVEVLKLEPEFLYTLLGATAERKVKPKKQPQTSIDCVPIGHTNPWEMERMQQNKGMEAFRDRIIRIDFPYLLRLSDEVRIYQKSFSQERAGDKHIAPHTLDVAALWAVLSRYSEPKDKRLDLLRKAKLLNGENVAGFAGEAARNLLKEAGSGEAMTGISPRLVQNVLGRLLARAEEEKNTTLQYPEGCVSPFTLLPAIEEELYTSNLIEPEQRDHLKGLLRTVREEYLRSVQSEVRRVVISDEKTLARLFENYLDNVFSSLDESERRRNPFTDAYEEPNEQLMQGIEAKLDPAVGSQERMEWRRELILSVSSLQRAGKEVDWHANDRLRRALEMKLFEDVKDHVKVAQIGDVLKDPETKEFIATLHTRLIEHGYCGVCADNLLREATSLFSRGNAE